MKPLIAEDLAADPRVAQAKALLAAAVGEHQAKLTGVQPPDPQRAISYQQLLDQFGALRGGALYFPYLGSGLGRGALVELGDGSVKYDMIDGIGVHHLGHNHPLLLEAGIDAALSDTVMQGNLQQTPGTVEFCRTLIGLASSSGAALRHCFPSTSGAMANENALKIVLQKRHPAARILAFEHNFAGRTMVLAQVTDKPAYRQGLPPVIGVDYVPFFDPARPGESTDAAMQALRGHLTRYPGQHAAMILELIQGENGGYVPGHRDFFLPLLELLREHKIAVVFDEIQTFGRTSLPFAFQYFGLEEFADIVTVGKMTQVCATLFTDDYAPRAGLVSQTFTGGTAAILAGVRILRYLQETHCFGNDGRTVAVHRRFAGHLERILATHPDWLSGPWGLGAMIVMTPFDGSDAKAKQFVQELFAAGVIGFVAGAHPTRVRFLPPVPIITDRDIDAVCGIIEATLAKVAGT